MNGAKFDKLARRGDMRKTDDDILRVLRKHSPDLAAAVERLDATFSAVLDKLQKIEDAHAELARQPSRIVATSREPNGEEVLASMRSMTPAAREALMMKLKQ
jgi:hypothetical protein